MHNWTYWSEHLTELSMQGYMNVLGVFVWPIIFTAIIGYVYLKNQSAVAAVAAILIIFAAFGNALLGVDVWYSLMYILVALVVTGLVLIFLTKIRR